MNQVGARLTFENALAKLKSEGYSTERAVLTQSYLRFEAPLNTNSSQYPLDVIQNSTINPAYPTQNKLALQDKFVIAEIGAFLAVPGTASVSDSAFRLISYNNAIQFPTGVVAQQMLTFYNGWLSLIVNQKVILTKWDLSRCFYVPQTQDGSAAAVVDEIDLSENGFYPCEPNIILSGDANNELTVNLPNAFSAVEANSRLVVIVRGILAQNVTSVSINR